MGLGGSQLPNGVADVSWISGLLKLHQHQQLPARHIGLDQRIDSVIFTDRDLASPEAADTPGEDASAAMNSSMRTLSDFNFWPYSLLSKYRLITNISNNVYICYSANVGLPLYWLEFPIRGD